MSREHKTLAGPEKLAILKRYLVEKVPISDLCDQHGLQPSQVYYWQAQLFEHGASILICDHALQIAAKRRQLKTARVPCLLRQCSATLLASNPRYRLYCGHLASRSLTRLSVTTGSPKQGTKACLVHNPAISNRMSIELLTHFPTTQRGMMSCIIFYVRQCIDAALEDANAERVVDVEDVRRRFGLAP